MTDHLKEKIIKYIDQQQIKEFWILKMGRAMNHWDRMLTKEFCFTNQEKALAFCRAYLSQYPIMTTKDETKISQVNDFLELIENHLGKDHRYFFVVNGNVAKQRMINLRRITDIDPTPEQIQFHFYAH